MDSEQFDDLTRSAGAGSGTRRLLLRMAGSAIGGVIARLGLGEDAEAKSRKHGRRHGDHERRGAVQAAGKKHKGNDKHKKKDKDKPKPCPAGFRRCSDGSCLSTQPGVCCLDEEFCPGGGCRPQDGCCPGDRQCYGTNTCVGPNECCSAEQKCADGECYPKDGCCPEHKTCTGRVCVAQNECCPIKPLCDECEEAICENGEWVCRSQCTDGKTCCNGQCVAPCTNGCTMDDGCGGCTEPPAGKTFCEGQDICVDACPDGKELDSATCQCRTAECQLDCDSQTGLCSSSGCGPQEWCSDGACKEVCGGLNHPCVYLDFNGQAHSYCCYANSRCKRHPNWGYGYCENCSWADPC